ncbi:MAG: hypothetical protein JF609_01755 [Verrucomicrobia bacterium]|nr:hypothetical protein [Verrucomicrobiota bacterium]
MVCAPCFIALAMAFTSTSVSAQVNSWTNPTNGDWDQATNWSLGVLPDGSQSVLITNSPSKSVAINPSTPTNFPGSMTVSNLTISGAGDAGNVLLLNYAGTAVPLTVLNGLTLQDGAQILNFNSGLVVRSGASVVTNSEIIQDGGSVDMANAPMNLSNARYEMTNGVFEGGTVWVGAPVFSSFNQYGGTVAITNLNLGPRSPGSSFGGAYALYGGTLDLPGGLKLLGDSGSMASYFQSGGTNRTTQVMIEPGLFGISPSFKLNGGLLADDVVDVFGDDFNGATLEQNGGAHIVSEVVSVSGGAHNPNEPHPAIYQLNAGILSAHAMNLDATSGDAAFIQSNGMSQVADIQAHSGGIYSYFTTAVDLSGGTLSCSNLFITDGGGIHQYGGALTVSNTLNVVGYREPGPRLYTRYEFFGGTLAASNINVDGDWIIGDSSGANRISNPGTCSLSHTLQIGNAVEQLGRFILVTNATIDLKGEAAKLGFANSSAEAWNSAAKLIVTNWNWLTSASTLGDQLTFGTNQSGLTAAQLQRIHFINPAGYAPGDYAAQISGTGEVRPGEPAAGDLTNDWSGVDGNWHDLTWSLGVRPDSSQTVRIIGGNRTVTVNATTAANYPESLTVHDLVVRGFTGTPGLVLSNAGTATPLRALNGLLVEDGARLVNLNSGLVVDGAVLTVTNAQIIQDGGFVRTTNATMRLLNGVYHMTNGVFEGGTVLVGTPYPAIPGQFNQYGGAVKIMNLGLYHNYSLYGGTLDLPGGMNLIGQQGGTSYFQAGGTNRTPHVLMEDDYAGSGPTLTLNGGLLAAGGVDVRSGWFGESTVVQNGGTHIVTNALNIVGGATTGATVRRAAYYLNAGTLSAAVIELNANGGDSLFVQSNGIAQADTFYAHSVGYFGSFNDYITLAGGSLSCANFTLDDGRGSFSQSGGALVVTNLLAITGYRDLNIRYYGRYAFTGGTVTRSPAGR